MWVCGWVKFCGRIGIGTVEEGNQVDEHSVVGFALEGLHLQAHGVGVSSAC